MKRLRWLARPNDWAISFDLSDGFRVCGVHKNYQQYMTFRVGEQDYSCAALPFGFNGSPYVFCRIMKTLTHLLRCPSLPVHLGDMTP